MSLCFFKESIVPGVDRQGMRVRAKWPLHRTIEISFLHASDQERARSEQLHEKIREQAGRWLSLSKAQLRFSWRDDTNDTDVRISLGGTNSWSILGTDCLKEKDPKVATMHLGLNPSSPPDRIARKTLHEFGHLLAMLHEHQLPDAPIDWDYDAVYRDLESPRMTRKMIQENLFDPISKGECNTTAFDPASIMVYPIEAHWTRNGYSLPSNSDLSPADIDFIKQQYGPPKGAPHG